MASRAAGVDLHAQLFSHLSSHASEGSGSTGTLAPASSLDHRAVDGTEPFGGDGSSSNGGSGGGGDGGSTLGCKHNARSDVTDGCSQPISIEGRAALIAGERSLCPAALMPRFPVLAAAASQKVFLA
eukprot:858373-Pleurochrysis_carterae.AAC.2